VKTALLGTVLRDEEIIPLEVETCRRIPCIDGNGEGVETGGKWAEHCCWTEVGEKKFHAGLRVRRAAVGGVNATTVDVANIIKMAKKIKTIVLEGKTANGEEEGLGRYVFFICYFFSYSLIVWLIEMTHVLEQGGSGERRLGLCRVRVGFVCCEDVRV
jgi:hypothetical protein